MNDSNFAAPISPLSLVDTITKRLEDAIFSGELAPGTKLSEQGLAKMLGVSRGPLREAVRRLEGRKLVVRTTNIGSRVAELSDDDLRNLMVVREALEGMAARCAAENATKEELAQLQELLESHKTTVSAADNKGYFQDRDLDFHVHIVRCSRNERLISMLCNDLYDLLRVYRYRSSRLKGRAKVAFDEHKAIVDAISARNPDLAEASMRKHLKAARAHLEQNLTGTGAKN